MSAAEDIYQAGRAAFPELAARRDDVLRLIRQRLEGEQEPAALAADEVYLACACALRDAAAITAFERRYFSVIPAALSRLALGRDEIAEIEQLLRIRLFVTDDEGVPRVVTYAGDGQLGGLVRVAAVRAGLNLLRDRGAIAPANDELEDVPITRDDPALASLKAQHRAAFKGAFADAIGTLESRERAVLELAIVKGVGIDKIGAIYGVHRATAARWIASARDRLARAVHRALATRLQVAPGELPDLLPLVESQLELSLERLLAGSRS